MFLSIWRCITLMFAALSLTMTSAHVLELPQKMQYDAHIYAAVNTTLYRYFAIVGGFYTVTSILATATLAFLVRKRGSTFRWTLAGAICLMLAFGTWLMLVAPVNSKIAQAIGSAPESIPALMDAIARPMGVWTRGRFRSDTHRFRLSRNLPTG